MFPSHHTVMAHLLYQFHIVHRVILCALSVKFLVDESSWYALLRVRCFVRVRYYYFLEHRANSIKLVSSCIIHLISFQKGPNINLFFIVAYRLIFASYMATSLTSHVCLVATYSLVD